MADRHDVRAIIEESRLRCETRWRLSSSARSPVMRLTATEALRGLEGASHFGKIVVEVAH